MSRAIPPLNENDLRLLRIFRSVAEAGGLSAAEVRLGMERSTISRHLSSLETRLGGRLCLRGPAGFELTDFGQLALRAAIGACDTLDLIRHELNLARGLVTGDLHIGIADNCLSNERSALVRALAKFRELAPDVTINLSVHLPADLMQGLLDRRLHLGITGVALGCERLRLEPLFAERFQLYVAAPGERSPAGLEDLRAQGYALVIRANDPHTHDLAQLLKLRRHAVAFGLDAVATLLASGGFVAFLPTHYAEALRPIHPFSEVAGAASFRYETTFSLASNLERPLPPCGELFARLLKDAQRDAASAAKDSRELNKGTPLGSCPYPILSRPCVEFIEKAAPGETPPAGAAPAAKRPEP